MKKQTKKLSLNKKTISNLNSSEMHRAIGGFGSQKFCSYTDYCGHSKNCTQNQNTCPDHASCYTC